MTAAEDSTDRAAEPPVCPECGKADHVQKISAIPDMPAEFGPPDKPSRFDLLGVVTLVGSLLLGVALAYVFLSDRLLDEEACDCILLVTLVPIGWGFRRVVSREQQR